MAASRVTPQSSEWNAPTATISNEPDSAHTFKTNSQISILFVCLGNICRSPMAEAVFSSLTAKDPRILSIDSAGTGAYHAGDPPDLRTLSTLEDNGIVNYDHAARKVRSSDFTNFDYILAMDKENLHDLEHSMHRLVKKEVGVSERALGKIMLFGDFGGKLGEQVVDPYYGTRNGFEVAYEQMTRFSKGFIAQVLDVRK